MQARASSRRRSADNRLLSLAPHHDIGLDTPIPGKVSIGRQCNKFNGIDSVSFVPTKLEALDTGDI